MAKSEEMRRDPNRKQVSGYYTLTPSYPTPVTASACAEVIEKVRRYRAVMMKYYLDHIKEMTSPCSSVMGLKKPKLVRQIPFTRDMVPGRGR